MDTDFQTWMIALDKLGIKENVFDAPNQGYACSGSKPRRPYTEQDGLFYQCFQSGMSPQQALAEAFVEQDWA